MYRSPRLAAVVAALALLVGMARPGGAVAAAPLVPQLVDSPKPGYDYAPSVLWDGHQWVMYRCGLADHDGYPADGIWRATSADGVRWSTPELVFRPGPVTAWDDEHVCDPTVLRGVDIDGYTWAMWYSGIGYRYQVSDPANDINRIGLALSRDGITWERKGIVVDCGPGPGIGCLQPSVVKTASGYVMTHAQLDCAEQPCRQNRVRTSTDGKTWTKGALFTLPQWAVGPEIMQGTDGTWYSTFGGDTRCGASPAEFASEIAVYASSTVDGERRLLGCTSWADLGAVRGFIAGEGGFFRDGLGRQLPGTSSLRVAFGLAHAELHADDEELVGAQVPLDGRTESRVRRIAGTDRVDTAVRVSAGAFLRSSRAVLARADRYADALAGGPFAAHFGGPVLLTGGGALDPRVGAELERLGVSEVAVLGGPAAVSPAVEQTLAARGLAVTRVAGADRYETSAAIARHVGGPTVYLAGSWPDALSAAAVAGAGETPILLTDRDRLPDPTRYALSDLAVTHATVVGGPAAVSDAVVAELTTNGIPARRVAGADRFETSRALADHGTAVAPRPVWLATGADWADSLVAGPAAVASGGVLLLVPPSDLPPGAPSASWLAARAGSVPAVRLVGGYSAIGPAVEGAVRALVP